MNGYNFSERVRRVLQRAREEAMALRHQYVGTEHILLALVREDNGVAAAVLEHLNITPDQVRERVLNVVRPGADPAGATSPKGAKGMLESVAESLGLGSTQRDLPYTSRGKKVLELAITEARELDHSYCGTEHLLLGLLREEKGIAAQVLSASGATLQAARQETLRLLGSSVAAPAPTDDERETTITLVVERSGGRMEARKFHSSEDAMRYLSQMGP